MKNVISNLVGYFKGYSYNENDACSNQVEQIILVALQAMLSIHKLACLT